MKTNKLIFDKLILTAMVVSCISGTAMATTVLYGIDNITSGKYSNAFGYKNTASGENATAVGTQNTASGNNAIVAGVSSTASGKDTVAIGHTANATGNYTVAIGSKAVAGDYDSIAIGKNAQASKAGTVVIGRNAKSDTELSLAVGTDTESVWGGTAVGVLAKATGTQSTALGNGTNATEVYSTAVGVGTKATGIASTAIGSVSKAEGNHSIAMGYAANSSGRQAIAIGTNARATLNNSVALGNNAKTNDVVGTSSIAINGETHTFAGGTPVGTVSVGDVNKERTITNVAAGRVSETSTDAINGSQLNSVVEETNKIGTKVNNHEGRITTLENKITDVGHDTLSQANSYTDSQVAKVGAQSAALAGLHPLDFNKDDKASYAASVGHYRNANAVAVGAFYRPNERTMVSGAISFGKHAQMNLGVAFKTGKGSEYINEAKSKDSRIEKLEALVNKLTAEVEELKTNK